MLAGISPALAQYYIIAGNIPDLNRPASVCEAVTLTAAAFEKFGHEPTYA